MKLLLVRVGASILFYFLFSAWFELLWPMPVTILIYWIWTLKSSQKKGESLKSTWKRLRVEGKVNDSV